MEKILICLSEGKRALSILKYARDFANNYSLPYEVLFVKKLNYIEDEMFFLEMPMLHRVGKSFGSDIMNIIDEAGKIVDKEVKFTILDDSANLLHILKQKHEQQDYSLLVLPHSLEMMNWPFMDSLNKFINEIECPILLVDPSSEFKEITKAVYASNYIATDANVLKRFQKISTNKVTKIDIIHISFSDNFTERIMEKGFKTYIEELIPTTDIQVHHIPAMGSQETTVELFLHEVAKISPEILILMKEDKSGWEDFFSKSFTLSTAKKTSIPMLILHERYSRGDIN